MNTMVETKLKFLVQWDKDKTKTWSGTVWSLFNALQHYFQVEEISLPNQRSLFRHIKHYLGYGDNYLKEKKLNGKYVEKIIGDEQVTVFQFGELLFDNNIRRTYIYQDLSMNYLYDIFKNDNNLFKQSGFSKTSINGLKYHKSYELEYYKGCSGIFTMSRWLANYLVTNCGIPEHKVHPVGGGINIDINKIDSSRKRGDKILFVGRDFERKGGPITIEAFKLLKNKMPNAKLYIAGPQKCKLAEDIEGVFFIGPTSYQETTELFNECDIFCMPSYFEAYGLVFIEALSFGLPCLGRNCCEMPYFIEEGKTGLLIDSDDPLVLANKMYMLLTDKSYTQNVREKADFYHNEYCWESVAERISKIIINR